MPLMMRLTLALLFVGFTSTSSLAYGRNFLVNNEVPESAFRRLTETEGLLPQNSLDSQGQAVIGLYADDGSWTTGKEHMKLFMNQFGYTYRSLSASQIQNGSLQKLGIKLLMMPGGESWTYLDKLGASGAKEIRNFVHQGGSYFGVCAGAYYAVANRDGGVTTGPYGIGLLDGTAYDGSAHKVEPFLEGMMNFDFFIDGFQKVFRIILLGGPSFRFSKEEAEQKQIQVLAEFQEIHEPAMIIYNYGLGKVFLSGPHLEIEESRTSWGPEYEDPESDWPIMNWIVSGLTNPSSFAVSAECRCSMTK